MGGWVGGLGRERGGGLTELPYMMLGVREWKRKRRMGGWVGGWVV